MTKKSGAKGPKKSGNHNGSSSVTLTDPDQRMGKEKAGKVSVEFKSAIAREEAISYFETIVAGLKKGTIQLKQDMNEITLEPPAQLEVKVKGTRKHEKEKLSFEISWRSVTANELKISSR